MLAAAKEYAGGDAALMGLIEDAEAEGARGRIGGASRTLSRLRAGKIDIFKVPFYGGRLARLQSWVMVTPTLICLLRTKTATRSVLIVAILTSSTARSRPVGMGISLWPWPTRAACATATIS